MAHHPYREPGEETVQSRSTVEDAWQLMPMKFINNIRRIEAEIQDTMRRKDMNTACAKIDETSPTQLSKNSFDLLYSGRWAKNDST